jgi:hypothetical protein
VAYDIANVFQLNFNDDGIRACVTNVPFSSHKSFPTEVEAWQYFTSYYPHFKSPLDAQFMNKNCPVKASNLNNPSQHFQEVSGLTFNIPRNTCEFFHFDDLPDTVQANSHAASARMRQLGLTPIDDFTFLHPQPNVTTTSPNIVSPLHPPSVINRNCDDSITADSMSIFTHAAINHDILSHASHLNLNTQPNPTNLTTQPNSTNKRARSRLLQSSPNEPTYISLSTPVNEPFSTTHTNLQHALSTASLPPSLLSLPLLAWVPPSAPHANKKTGFYSTPQYVLLQPSPLRYLNLNPTLYATTIFLNPSNTHN